jgi:flagellar basal body P-ring formation protein FlgA
MRKVLTMISFGIRIFSLLFALAALLTGSAAAQDAAPALRATVTVTGGIVRIGDLIDNAGAVADVAIFRSPDLGTRGAVSTASIVAAIRQHQLVDIDTRGLAEVIVTRASRAIQAQDISATIAQAIAAQFGIADAQNISVYFDRDVRTLQVEADATGDLQVLNLTYDPHSTRFDVTLDLPSSAELHRQPARFTGTALETVAVVSVEHPVERGALLKESDLTVLRRPKSEGGGISSIAQVVGLATRRELRPDQPLHAADLTKPDIIQRNDTVAIIYQAPGIVLTLRGQAQAGGAIGDTIGVLNVDSKRIVQGVITAPGRVTVSAVTTRMVDNSPAQMVMSPPAAAE